MNDRPLRYGEGWITPRGTKWQAHWRDGDRYRAKTFVVEDDAIEFLQTMGREKRRGTYIPPSEQTVRDMIADYLERKKDDWSGNTYDTYVQRTAAFIEPYLGSFKVVELTTPLVQHWVDKLRRKGVSASTISNARAILTGACTAAVHMGVIRSSPMAGLKTPTVRHKPHRTWTIEQVRTVLADVRDEPMWHALYRMELTTGMRPGEIRALRWSDIDMKRKHVIVQRTMTRDDAGKVIVGDKTKTHKARVVAIPASCVAALRTWEPTQKIKRLAASRWDEGGYVFTSSIGAPLSPKPWQNRQDRLCALPGMTTITLHELRHTYATIELSAGTPVKVVSERLGHAKVQITMDLYMHVSPEMQEAAVEAMEARLA
ncbi:MAG: tyrosine-type recombinase/integrase [Thermomicrobiales bacterium]